MSEKIANPCADPNQQFRVIAETQGLTLIPLNRWDKVERSPDGKTVEFGKRPLHSKWMTRAYDSRQVIAERADGQNLGVRLRADWLVLDVDPRNSAHADLGESADHMVARLSEAVGADLMREAFLVVRTGSGGLHLYFVKPTDVTLVDTVRDERWAGFEFKSRGRQVVAPGSRHPSGGLYAIERHNPAAEFNAAPEGLIEMARRKATPAAASAPAGKVSPEELAAMLEGLDPADFPDNASWEPLMMACHHATAGAGREEFIAWSTGFQEFPDVGRRWDSLRVDPGRPAVTEGTLYAALRDAGRADLIPRSTAEDDFAARTPAIVEGTAPVYEGELRANKSGTAADDFTNAITAVTGSGLELAFDELKQRVVFRARQLPWDEAYGRELNDHTARMIRLALIEQHRGLRYQPSRENVFEAAMTIAYLVKFNPVTEYLNRLEWDGVERVGRLFPSYFATEDDAFSRAVSTCFMVSAVRRQRRPGCKVDTMPVLKGRQGAGKSSGLRALFGADWFSDASLGDLGGKDAALGLQGIWVQEFAELDGMRRSEVNTLKAFCSRAVDRVRKPYGREFEELQRRCVFAGTVNEGGYLTDPTGNRRFWPLTVEGRVDVEALARDRDQLWAEASAMEGAKVRHVLDEALWPEAAQRQAEETAEDPWAEPIRAHLRSRTAASQSGQTRMGMLAEGAASRPADRVHSQHLLSNVLEIPVDRQNRGHAQRLRGVMENDIGWSYRKALRIGDQNRAGYAGDPLS